MALSGLDSCDYNVTVTEIKSIDSKQMLIYLDGEKAFRLYKGELKRLHLSEGSVLSKDEYDDILSGILCPRCIKKSYYLLSKQDYTEYKLREKLVLADYPEDVVDITIDELISRGYINDLNYAKNFIEYRVGSDGIKSLSLKLKSKGISAQTIEQAISELGELGIDINESEKGALNKALMKKIARTKGDINDQATRSKIISYMLSKGYKYSDVQAAIENYISD